MSLVFTLLTSSRGMGKVASIPSHLVKQRYLCPIKEALSRISKVPMRDPQGAHAGSSGCSTFHPSETDAAAWGWAAQHNYVPSLTQPGKADRWILELLCADNYRLPSEDIRINSHHF